MSRKTKKLLLSIPLIILVAAVVGYLFFPGATLKTLIRIERGIAGLDQKSIDVGSLHFEYLEGGEGEVLVLLHGFGGNKDNWTRLARYLTPHFRVIAPDLPGFGESSRDMGVSYRFPDQVERLHLFIEALQIERFHLGGNSMGGNLAGNYAAEFEGDLISLWLIATGGVISPEPSELSLILKAAGRNPLVAKNEAEYDQLLDFVFVKKPFIPGPIKRYLSQEAINHSPLNQVIFKQISSTDPNNFVPLEVLLKNVKTKTLILWGDRDRVLHVSGGKLLESAMPNAKCVIMENIGHVPMVENPEESAKIFMNFLGRNQT